MDLVHIPCLRSTSGAHPVDLVRHLKVDLVHLCGCHGAGRAEKGFGALGRRKRLLPGAEKGLGALGGRKRQSPGAEKGLSARGGDSFRCRVDEVGFQGVDLVHIPCLRSSSGAHPVDLVRHLKVDLVHLFACHGAGRGRKGPWRPWREGKAVTRGGERP